MFFSNCGQKKNNPFFYQVEYTSYHDGVTAPLLHGEAVSIGMCVSADIALVMGLCDEGCVRATYEACETVREKKR